MSGDVSGTSGGKAVTSGWRFEWPPFALICAVGVVVAVAYALDPSIVPPEWTDKARDFVGQYIKI